MLLLHKTAHVFRGWVPRGGFCFPYIREGVSSLDAKTRWKEGFHGNLQAAGSCLYAIFFLMQTGFLAQLPMRNLAGNLKWPNCRV
jgi:hypothetical protein